MIKIKQIDLPPGTTTTAVTDGQALTGAEAAELIAGKDTANNAQFIATDTSGRVQIADGGGSITVDGTVAVSGTVPVSDAGGSLTVDGSVSVSNFPATQPISAASLPLPTGAATEATLATRLTESTFTIRTPTVGQKTAAGSSPVVLASDQTSILVNTPSVINAGNSTTTPLAAGATFTGTPIFVRDYAAIGVHAFADAASATDGLKLQWSPDGTNWDGTLSFNLAANRIGSYVVGPGAGYFRVRLQNGGSAQTVLRLQTVLHATQPRTGTTRLSDVPDAESDATLVKSVITGKTTAGGGSYVDVKVSPSGSVSVDGSVTANIGTTNGLALDATLTGGSQKAVVRGGTKGSTTAADVTSSASGANRQLLDVAIYDSAGNQITSFGGGGPGGSGTEYADGAARGTATGTLMMVDDGTNIQSASGDTAGRQNVNSRVTDGTSTAAVKAASTAAAATDPALVVAISPNNTIPVSAASLPLPTGAATETTLATRLTEATFTTRTPTVGQKAMAASSPVVLASDQSAIPITDNSGSLTVDGTVTANIGTTNGLALNATLTNSSQKTQIADSGGLQMATVKGGSTAAVGADTALVVAVSPNNTVTVSGTVTSNIGTTNGLALDATLTGGTQKAIARGGAKGSTTAADVTSTASGANHQPLDVAIYDASGNQITSFGGGTQFADGAARGSATGTLMMVDDGTNIQSASGDTSGRLNANSRITDGTNTAAVKAASTAVSSTDPALVVAISPNNTVQVSAASWVLPAGAATEATLATRLADATFTGRINTQGQKTMAASTPVVLASDQSAIPVADGGGSLTVDGTVTANIGTTNGLALDATLTGGTARSKITDGTNNAAVKAASTAAAATDPALVVAISPNNALSVSDGGGSLTVDTTQLPAALVGSRLDVNNGAWLGSTAPTVGSKTSANSIPVVVASDQGAIPVSAASLPLPTGAATETTLGTRLADSTFTGRINTQGQKTMAASTPVVLASDQSAVPVSGTVTSNIGTTNGLALDATLTGGTQKAVVRGGAKGATTAADVTSSASGSDHQLLDVAIYDASGAQITSFGGDVAAVDGTATFTATGQTTLPTSGKAYNLLRVTARGTFSAQVRVEVSSDNSTWSSTYGATTSLTSSPSLSTPSSLLFALSGYKYTRLNCFAYTSGTMNIDWQLTRSELFTPGTGGPIPFPLTHVVDSNGAIQPAGDIPSRAINVTMSGGGASSILTNVTAATSSTTLLAANGNRRGATIWNDSTSVLYVKFGSTASATSCTVKMVADSYYEVPFSYPGIITGIWVSATGAARVTEVTV